MRMSSGRMDEQSCVEIIESVNSIVLRWNSDFIITYMNRYGERFFGYGPDELIGRSVIGTIVPERGGEGEDLREMMGDIFRNPGRYVSNENENMRKDGSRVWVSWTNRAVVVDNRVVEIMSIGSDITDRKQMEKELRRTRDELEARVLERTRELQESEARLHSIFRAVPSGIGLVLNRVIIEANARLCEMTGYAREELVGQNARMLYPTQEDYDYVGTEKYRQISERGTGTVETRWRHKDGHIMDILLSSTPIDPESLSAGVTFTALDITERKRAESALEHAKAQAELYVDLMGHDISNMNQAIMGYLELAELAIPMEPEQMELIRKPIEIINHSARMIDNVRKLERIQKGMYTEKVVDMCEIINRVISDFSAVEDRCVTINRSMPDTCHVIADDIVRDVFSNIVENSIRHTTGPVTIDIVVEPREACSRRCYWVSIADDGPGIPDELKRQVFTFLQGYKVTPGRRGLGLCLVKTLVERFKGQVWVEDRVPGDYRQGAKFMVELPAA